MKDSFKGQHASTTNIVKQCEVCGNTNLKEVLNLGSHPLCDDLIAIGASDICEKYPIEILLCEKCKTAHQKCQPPKEVIFSKEYHYRSHFTQDVLKGMENLVCSCSERFGTLKGKNVIDIGCNDGSLLSFFETAGANCFGVEPTDAALEAREKGYKIYQNYFTPTLAKQILADIGQIDFITFTNVFAHIENLPELIEAVNILASDDTVIVIENHYLGSILARRQFDTFYHEHVRSYSVTSFMYIASQLNCLIADVMFPKRYGGNVRVYFKKKGTKAELADDVKNIIEDEETFISQFEEMQSDLKCWINKKKSYIESQVKRFGVLPAKAFPGRAAILIALLGLDENSVAAVYEKSGSKKIGYYVPGTRIPILDEVEFFSNPELLNKPLINLAWHIADEIENYVRVNGFKGDIINIIDRGDFEH